MGPMCIKINVHIPCIYYMYFFRNSLVNTAGISLYSGSNLLLLFLEGSYSWQIVRQGIQIVLLFIDSRWQDVKVGMLRESCLVGRV